MWPAGQSGKAEQFAANSKANAVAILDMDKATLLRARLRESAFRLRLVWLRRGKQLHRYLIDSDPRAHSTTRRGRANQVLDPLRALQTDQVLLIRPC